MCISARVYTLTSNKYGIINQLRALVGLDAINFYTCLLYTSSRTAYQASGFFPFSLP